MTAKQLIAHLNEILEERDGQDIEIYVDTDFTRRKAITFIKVICRDYRFT